MKATGLNTNYLVWCFINGIDFDEELPHYADFITQIQEWRTLYLQQRKTTQITDFTDWQNFVLRIGEKKYLA